jgi:hypothetical protein
MEDDQLIEQIKKSVVVLQNAFKQYDIAVALLHSVVERTSNYREYYFSSVKLKELERNLNYRLQFAPFVSDSGEGFVTMLEDAILDVHNIAATYTTEADRIDAIGPVA